MPKTRLIRILGRLFLIVSPLITVHLVARFQWSEWRDTFWEYYSPREYEIVGVTQYSQLYEDGSRYIFERPVYELVQYGFWEAYNPETPFVWFYSHFIALLTVVIAAIVIFLILIAVTYIVFGSTELSQWKGIASEEEGFTSACTNRRCRCADHSDMTFTTGRWRELS